MAAANSDAYIKHAPGSDTWAIGNASIEFDLGFDSTKHLVAQGLWNPATANVLDIDQAPDTAVTLNGDRLLLAQSDDKMSLAGTTMEQTDTGVRLVFTFEHRTLHTVITRTYACYGGTPTIETWTRLESPAGTPGVAITDPVAWQLTMPSAPVQWINGLRGDSAGDPVPVEDSFTFDGGALDDGETDIGSTGRSSESFIPIVFVQEPSLQFYGGPIWSGSWRIAMVRSGDRTSVATSFPGITTSLTPDHPIEFPHAFLGFSEAGINPAGALRRFVVQGVRRGRPMWPLVTYNTWFPYGTAITEADVDEEMHRASSIGVELFVLDAGWWAGAGSLGQGDFSSGLGSYIPDPGRFPARLVGLSDEAHALGMKFGLWVEPERIALSTVGGSGMALESWLATESGSYNGDGLTAQLCLASAAGRKWVFTKLANLIDTVHPDYIKWDNNFWINCDRAGHGHGAGDGNYAHVMGLYALLDELRQRYPDLLIENVSGGGNRLDYGMLAYSDTAWMDDLSAPSSHVRHNLEGLSTVFPPDYLLSFVIDSAEESLQSDDLPQIVRSRMPGVLGVTYRFTEMPPEVMAGLAEEVSRYVLLRGTISQSSAALLSQQAPVAAPGWDVLQEVSDDQRQALVFAFKNDETDGQINVRPKGLAADAVYDVQSLDNGDLGMMNGADLMLDGIDVVHVAGSGSSAHVLVLNAQ